MGAIPIYRRVLLRLLKMSGELFSDSLFIKLKFYLYMGSFPDLKSPKTFNEKLQWLKLHNRHDIHTKLVDKIEVKKYVEEKIGSKYIIPTLTVYDRIQDIDISKLPDKFVLKCNHNSGGIVICRNKGTFDLDNAKKILQSKLKQNYFKIGREWPYKNVTPRILAEQYIEGDHDGDLYDYKFFCFNGKVKMCLVCAYRNEVGGVKLNFYDRDWHLLPFTRHYGNIPHEIKKPDEYQEMIEVAEKLASDFKFIRVDLYLQDDKILFGELTFFPGNGWGEFTPEEWDYKVGEWLDISPDKKKL